MPDSDMDLELWHGFRIYGQLENQISFQLANLQKFL